MHYSKQIKKARKALKLRQIDVAAMVNVHPRIYQRIEAGYGTNTSTLERICKALNITIQFPETCN